MELGQTTVALRHLELLFRKNKERSLNRGTSVEQAAARARLANVLILQQNFGAALVEVRLTELATLGWLIGAWWAA